MSILDLIFDRKSERAFDEWADDYEDIAIEKIKRRGYDYDDIAILIKDCTPSTSTSLLLAELGVGPGIVGCKLKSIMDNVNIDGVDISTKMLEKARKKKCYRRLVKSSANELSVLECKYDFVYTSFMMHSLPNIYNVLEQIKLILNDNGRFLLIDLYPREEHTNFLSKLCSNFHSMKHEKGAFSNYRSISEVNLALKHSGFNVIVDGSLGKDKGYFHHYHLCELTKNEQ